MYTATSHLVRQVFGEEHRPVVLGALVPNHPIKDAFA